MLLQQACVISSNEIEEATDKVILPQSFLDAILSQHTQRDLPYPLTFSITNGTQKTHVGVREFSAPEGTVRLPFVVAQNLAVKPGTTVSIRLVELEKGQSAKLRPLVGGYDLNQDWKVALEGAFRSSYTALTKGDVIVLKSGMKFLVDDATPADAICIIDTDLEVDLEPLSQEQAAETMQANEAVLRAQAETMPLVTDQSAEGLLSVGVNHFKLDALDTSRPVRIQLESDYPDVSLLLDTGEEYPEMRRNLWCNLSSTASKALTIELGDASSLRISLVTDQSAPFSILATQTLEETPSGAASSTTPAPGGEDITRCDNCFSIVPTRSLMLHERHCKRHNVPCTHPGCSFIYKRGLDMQHWHCTQCQVGGEGSLARHIEYAHTPTTCECGAVCPSLPDLARHCATICPARLILCRFCHLRVPQGSRIPRPAYMIDAAKDYAAHESQCGARTTICDSCARPIKLSDAATHAMLHEAYRKTHASPEICHNVNCVRLRDAGGRNPVSLCEACYGPLYRTSIHDASLDKIKERIARRHLMQLVTGCRHVYCRNAYCATAISHKASFAEASARVQNMPPGSYSFCVDKSTQTSRTQAEVLACEGNYSVAWCCRAIDLTHGDVSAARGWLAREAVKISEV